MRILVLKTSVRCARQLFAALKDWHTALIFAMTETKQLSCLEWKSTILFYLILIYPVQTG